MTEKLDQTNCRNSCPAGLTEAVPVLNDHPIMIVVFDRNRMASQLLASVLGKDPRFHPVAASSIQEALHALNSEGKHIAVISSDLDSGRLLGAQFARTARARWPRLGIVILLDCPEKDAVLEAIRFGATGIFSRTEPISEFVKCIEHVSQGKLWAGQTESDFLMQAIKSIPTPKLAKGNGNLTKRELQVVQQAARGYTNKVIAENLRLSEHTVKNYLFRSFEKLGVSSRVELLFFLTTECKTSLDLLQEHPTLDNYCKAAQEGFAAAISALSIAAEATPHNSDDDVYFCLRLMERYSEQIQSESHSLAVKLMTKIDKKLIQKMDSKVEATFGSSPNPTFEKNYPNSPEWPILKTA